MANKFAVIGTDQSAGMPIGEGKNGMAVPSEGPFAKGYKNVKGAWKPHGMGVVVFDTEQAANQWIASADGVAWLNGYDNVILARLKA